MIVSRTPGSRPGISLLEVLVALGVFLLSLVAIFRLVTFASERAVDVHYESRALQLCQSKMAEAIAGVVPVSSPQSETPFDEDSDWSWSMDSEQGNVAGLWNVTVRVSRQRPDGSKMEVALSRMILDPSLRGAVGTGTGSSDTAGGATTQAGGSATASGGSSGSTGAAMSGASTPSSGSKPKGGQ